MAENTTRAVRKFSYRKGSYDTHQPSQPVEMSARFRVYPNLVDEPEIDTSDEEE